MGVAIVADSETACLFCTTSMFSFGPVLKSEEEARAFLDWLHPTDPRGLSDPDLECRVSEFRSYINKKAEERKLGDEYYHCPRCDGPTNVRKYPDSVYEEPGPEPETEELLCHACIPPW